METFLTLLIVLIVAIASFVWILHRADEIKREEKILIKYDFEKNNFGHKAKIFFIKQVREFCIIGIVLIALSLAYFILSRTVLKEFIESCNNRIIEEALIVKSEIRPILEAMHNFPVEIEFNRIARRSASFGASAISGIYKFNIFHQNLKENIMVEWELIEGEIIIKSITKLAGRESINIFSLE